MRCTSTVDTLVLNTPVVSTLHHINIYIIYRTIPICCRDRHFVGNATDFCLVVKAIIVLFGLYYYDTYCYYTIRGARDSNYYETLLGTITCDIIVVTTCARYLRRDVYRIANSGA